MTDRSPARPNRTAWLLLALAMALTVLVYWPALHGGYLFDDGVYFADNTDVHVTTLHLADWVRAALQQAGTHQFRALSMLSFAANYYFTGLDPFWPKLTNLAIHLVNGWLLFLLLRELFRLRAIVAKRADDVDGFTLAAAAIAAVWLLLPINFTGVAYVVQRMESLANIFVFLGLYGYLRLRRREYAQGNTGAALFLCLLACMALGYSAKETGVMLPLYAACVEVAIARLRNADGKFSRPVLWTHGLLLILPLIAGLAWLAPGLWQNQAHNTRTFSLAERLLTEPRVLCDYIGWSLFPNLGSLTFYHDDLPMSHGLLDPPTTLLAILALAALLGIALWKRRTMPLFCLGTLWFFAGHILTATIIMLEPVFEHRNYFASAGLLLALASLLALEPGLSARFAKTAITLAFTAACAFTTYLRAEEWSNPLRLAQAEAMKRPDSQRAQYDLARTLIIASGDDEHSPLLAKASEILERDALNPASGIAPLQALIFVNRRDPARIDPHWWQAIAQKLRSQPPSETDKQALIFLFNCQRRNDCPRQTQPLFDAFVAALESSNGDVYLMSAYAEFALDLLGDLVLAERMSRDVVAARPQVPVYRANLTKLLIAIGKYEEAGKVIDDLASLNRAGSLDAMIADLHARLAAAKATPAESNP